MNTSIPFILISAERGDNSDEINAWRSDSLRRQLATIASVTFTLPMNGSYKGVPERSFLVMLPQGEASPAYADVLRLAHRWGQESVLFVDANRQAYLQFIDPATRGQLAYVDHIGEWQESEVDKAAHAGDYSQSPDGRYWRVVARRA